MSSNTNKKTELEIDLGQSDIELIDAIGKANGFNNRSEVVVAALKTADQILRLSKILKD